RPVTHRRPFAHPHPTCLSRRLGTRDSRLDGAGTDRRGARAMRRAILGLAVLVACHTAAPSPVPVRWGNVPLVAPESLGFDSTRLDSVVSYLRTQVDSAFPGAVVAVG